MASSNVTSLPQTHLFGLWSTLSHFSVLISFKNSTQRSEIMRRFRYRTEIQDGDILCLQNLLISGLLKINKIQLSVISYVETTPCGRPFPNRPNGRAGRTLYTLRVVGAGQGPGSCRMHYPKWIPFLPHFVRRYGDIWFFFLSHIHNQQVSWEPKFCSTVNRSHQIMGAARNPIFM
jgi:hypothetical protein